MELTLAVLADYANLSQEGKLNVMGIFSIINPTSLPFQLPMAYIVTSFEVSPAEAGMEKTVHLDLIDTEANSLFRVEQKLLVPRPTRPGSRAGIISILGVGGLRFEHPGDYQLSILIGGDEKRSVPLYVNEPNTGGT